ncbi:SRPBCC family protein [Streptomyces spectabilis]|uniref:Aromatic-ring-hydroxylating dioxygenase alpha subunit C-terminal domain-containing protein n=1 Tax=Streptomyces spectabilis TaxID=68270 RepID=A0A516R297_STRST|nr:SRPBCC family protein [Streptomyces spectabilis]QDQ09777.1 hypothetical protein FH965_03730 [Streptomyces spectabilis]
MLYDGLPSRPGPAPASASTASSRSASSGATGCASARSRGPVTICPGLGARQLSGMTIAGVFPNLALALVPDSVTCLRWIPTGPTSHDALVTVLRPPSARDSFKADPAAIDRRDGGPALRGAGPPSRRRSSPYVPGQLSSTRASSWASGCGIGRPLLVDSFIKWARTVASPRS